MGSVFLKQLKSEFKSANWAGLFHHLANHRHANKRPQITNKNFLSTARFRSQSGNIFMMLFGMVGMVGVIGGASMTIMKGPVKTMAEVTKRTVAENNMIATGKLALIAATSLQDADCDSDLTVEPIPFGAAITGFTGGGAVPVSIGTAKQDPWGTDYGYCVWDHGSSVDSGGCSGENRLAGGDVSSEIVLAIISAGPDGVWQTSCQDFVDANSDDIPDNPLISKTSGADDLIMGYTYNEAAAMSGGVWNIQDGDPNKAEIKKNLSVKGNDDVERFAFDADAGNLTIGGAGSFPSLKTDFLSALTGGGNIDILSPLSSTGNITTSADVSANDVSASGDVTASTLTGTALVSSGTLGVTGTSTLGVVNAGAVIASSLSTSGSATIGTTLDVSGAATLDSLDVTNAATVGGSTILSDTLSVTGATTLSNTLGVSGKTAVGGSDFDGTLTITGASDIAAANTVGQGGLVIQDVAGDSSGYKMRIDSNEIQVSNDGAVSGFGLQPYGGTVHLGYSAPGSSSIDMNTGKIIDLAAPTNAADAANKAYVDSAIGGVTGTNETDPQVGDISTAGKWCQSNGTEVVCDLANPTVAGNGDNLGDHVADQDLDMATFDISNTGVIGFTGEVGLVPISSSDTLGGLTCTDGQVAKWNNGTSQWICAGDGQGVTTESDPQVQTVTNGKWCKGISGNRVRCTYNAPSGGANCGAKIHLEIWSDVSCSGQDIVLQSAGILQCKNGVSLTILPKVCTYAGG